MGLEQHESFTQFRVDTTRDYYVYCMMLSLYASQSKLTVDYNVLFC